MLQSFSIPYFISHSMIGPVDAYRTFFFPFHFLCRMNIKKESAVGILTSRTWRLRPHWYRLNILILLYQSIFQNFSMNTCISFRFQITRTLFWEKIWIGVKIICLNLIPCRIKCQKGPIFLQVPHWSMMMKW